MKKNLYYKAVFARKNILKEFCLMGFLILISGPRLLLEVFIRKNFGERYFSMFQAVCLSIFLFFIPIAIAKYHEAMGDMSYNAGTIMMRDLTWYLFLAAFLYFSYQRQQEIKREPSVFDFARFSLSTGEINDRFYQFKIRGKVPDPRTIATVLEPAFFLAIGIVLAILQQKVGVLLIFSSIFYSLGYRGAYYQGDMYIMDKIDEMICNEELSNSFVDDQQPKDTRGFYAYGRRPSNAAFRKQVVDSFFEEEPTSDVI